jgi:hypothetical protein
MARGKQVLRQGVKSMMAYAASSRVALGGVSWVDGSSGESRSCFTFGWVDIDDNQHAHLQLRLPQVQAFSYCPGAAKQ